MSMIDIVRGEMMAAMKAKDAARKNALSELLSALKAKAIDNQGAITETEALEVVSREAKQMRETIESIPEGHAEMLEECKQKLAVFCEFLPAQMDEAEIHKVVKETLAELGLSSPTGKDRGLIMKTLMPKVKGKADGKLVGKVLADYLA